ncbi:MAG TPA: GTP-binding protein [Prolixibacteraceae bacterium]|nr:GTP-binding protein [Prolixibacteraceae bacterium]
MTPFYLITGFLGSGKTTFLKHILDSIGAKKRIAIIQNEFAPTGIDGKLLKNNTPNFQLIEINNGSVFCACLLSNFVETLEQIVEKHQPELIFLEASGLADPINMAEILQSEKLASKLQLRHIYCLADAVNYFKGLQIITRYQHQLIIADTILLNKTDLVGDEEIERIRFDIRSKNPHAKVYETTFAQYNFENDFNAESLLLAKHFEITTSGGKPELNVVVLRNHIKLSEEQLEGLMQKLQTNCIRVKGIIQLANGKSVALQATFDSWDIQPINAIQGPSEWIVFGEITPNELRQTFKEISNSNQ